MARPKDPETRSALLQAAEEIFAARGLEEARVEDITARAGRSKGSFYLHFPSKEAIFRYLVDRLLDRIADHIRTAPGSVGEDMERVLREAVSSDRRLLDLLWTNRALARMVFSGGGSADFGFVTEALAERAQANARAWLEAARAAGWYRDDMDPAMSALFVAGAYDRVARMVVRAKQRPDVPRLVSELHRFAARAIGTPRLITLVEHVLATMDAPNSPLAHSNAQTRKAAHAS